MNNRTRNSIISCLTLTFPYKSPEHLLALQKKMMMIVTCLFAMILSAGCASTKLSTEPLVAEQLPRPAHIWVYNFAATAADMPDDSSLVGQYPQDDTYQTAEYIETGRKVGAQIAEQLVKDIRGMGLPAVQTMIGTTPPVQVNDIVIRGYLISLDEGSVKRRVIIGFKSGTSELKVYAEGFQVTAQGLRKLGSGTTDSSGSKTPGTAVGVASLAVTHSPVGLIVGGTMKVYGEKSGRSKVEGRAEQTAKEIANVLKKRFKQQGWIN